MLFNFIPSRRRQYRRQMIIWTIGIIVIVPVCMLIFPYLIDKPLEKWGITKSQMLGIGFAFCALLFWPIGVIAGFLAHLFNPLTADERFRLGDQTSRSQK